MNLLVLRLGHRRERDHRISTHCGLVARALGADEIIYTGDKDEKMFNSINNVAKNWGGSFKVTYSKNWKPIIHNFKGDVIHLTMYGMPIQKKIATIRKSKKDKLIIVGGEKVPPEIYNLARYNVSVTNQPHSEIAALAIFLDHLFKGKELNKQWKNGNICISPRSKSKKVMKVNRYKAKQS